MSPSRIKYNNLASGEQQSPSSIQLQLEHEQDEPEAERALPSSPAANVLERLGLEGVTDDEEYRELKRKLLEIEYYRMQLVCRQMEIKMNLPTSEFTESLYHDAQIEEE